MDRREQAAPLSFPAVWDVSCLLLLTGLVAAASVNRIPCHTQCFWGVTTRVLPRIMLACGVVQVVAAALALPLEGRPHRALASVSLAAAAAACRFLLIVFIALVVFSSGDGGLRLGGRALGFFLACGVASGGLVTAAFRAVLWEAE